MKATRIHRSEARRFSIFSALQFHGSKISLFDARGSWAGAAAARASKTGEKELLGDNKCAKFRTF
jgi:hypothetical protein